MGKKPCRSRFSKGRNGCGNQKSYNKDAHYEERKVAEWTARLEAKRKRSSSAPPAQRTPATLETTRQRTAEAEAAEEAEDAPTDAVISSSSASPIKFLASTFHGGASHSSNSSCCRRINMT